MKPFCFSLSGIYESEGYAWEQAGKIWDLRELRGTDGSRDGAVSGSGTWPKKRNERAAADPPSGFRQLSLYEQIAAGTGKRRFVFSRIRQPYRYAAAGASSGALLRFLDPGCCRGVSKHQRNLCDRPAGGVGAGNRSDGACLVCDTGRARRRKRSGEDQRGFCIPCGNISGISVGR